MYEKISEQKERLEIISALKQRLFKQIKESTDDLIQILKKMSNRENIIVVANKIAINQRIKELFEGCSFMEYYCQYIEFDNVSYIIPIEILKTICFEDCLLEKFQYVFKTNIFDLKNESDIAKNICKITDMMVFDEKIW